MMDVQADTLYGAFEDAAGRAAEKTALVYLGETFTYRRLKEMVLALAASLAGLGVGEGDRVILYLFNMPQTVMAWLALQRLGATAVPVAPVYGSFDLRYLAKDSGAETIFCMDGNFNYLSEVLPETPIKRIVVTNMVDLLPGWKRLLARGFDRVPKGRFPAGKEIHAFRDLVRNGRPADLPEFTHPSGRHTALILYTGGTTGFPKGVPLSTGLFLHRVLEWRRAARSVVPLGESVTLLAAPLYHVIGQMDAFTPLLTAGETLLVMPRVVLDAAFDHIQRYRATNMFAVPAMYRMILDHDRLGRYDLGSLKYCGTGGDVLPLETASRWKERFGVPLYQGYGATEFCGAITLAYAHDGEPPEGSIGRVSPGSRVRLVDPETLEPVPPGKSGELLGTSPFAVTEYWNKPEETAGCFFQIEGETWYRTKDILEIREDGWAWFLDRSVDMIKHKGYRIAAAEVEKVLQEHHAVTAACVVGIPDEKVGERIKAFVVPRTDVRGISGYELNKWCRERLAPYKVPHYIEFRDMLPKSKVGKMLRREIRAEEQRKKEG